jgi:hypothetical protein
LDDAARLSGRPQLHPTLVRHHVPQGAPPHLAVDLERLHRTTRGKTLLIVAPAAMPDALLNRVDDARHAGATILALQADDAELQELAYETLTVTDRAIGSFDTPQDLLAWATTDEAGPNASARLTRRLGRTA